MGNQTPFQGPRQVACICCICLPAAALAFLKSNVINETVTVALDLEFV